MGAVFISYCSQDAPAAERICEALRAVGVDVWLDKNELRGGDAWDAQIRKRIHDCALFVPVISANTNTRNEGYFRREWKQATRRLQDMADDVAFLVPVVIDETREADSRVPEEFLSAQWTWLPSGETPPAFAKRVRQLLGLDPVPSPTAKVSATGAIKPSARSARTVRPRDTSFVRRFVLPLIALLLVVGGGTFWYFQYASETPAATPAPSAELTVRPIPPNEKSIAVLPFADMSAEKNQEYMADGIADELLNLLAQAPDLKVIARTSSFAFKGQSVDVSEIARRLDVAHVLEGSVRTSGDKLRVTAQLVRAADSTRLWSERYDRPMKDIFAVQDEIASAIVQALQIRLKGGTLNRRAGGTQNLAAYQLYLQAVSATNENSKVSLEAAENYANQAVKLDPKFGLAWYQLADIADHKLYSGYLTHQEGYERIQDFAEHALRLSPEIAEAHITLAGLILARDFNWPASKAELQRAVAIDPTNTKVVVAVATVAGILGNYDDAERKIRAAMQRDPLDFALEGSLSEIYFRTGRLTEAETIARSAIERQPEAEGNHAWLAQILLLQGKVVAALAELERETGEQARAGSLPLVLHAAGRRTEAEAALKTLIENWGNEYGQGVARAYAFMGNNDRAMEWLELAFQQKDSSLYAIVGSPLYGVLPDDPRYKAFLRNRLKQPV